MRKSPFFTHFGNHPAGATGHLHRWLGQLIINNANAFRAFTSINALYDFAHMHVSELTTSLNCYYGYRVLQTQQNKPQQKISIGKVKVQWL